MLEFPDSDHNHGLWLVSAGVGRPERRPVEAGSADLGWSDVSVTEPEELSPCPAVQYCVVQCSNTAHCTAVHCTLAKDVLGQRKDVMDGGNFIILRNIY